MSVKTKEMNSRVGQCRAILQSALLDSISLYKFQPFWSCASRHVIMFTIFFFEVIYMCMLADEPLLKSHDTYAHI